MSPVPQKKSRADALLVEQGLAPTRSKAQALILAGEVFVGDERVDKAGALVPVSAALRVRERERYVSRGGSKLEGALLDFGFDPRGLVVADIGASTGGFTDCVLEHGASRVYAVDVGHGQLAEKLRQDPRVQNLERTNARSLTAEALEGGVDLTVVDASFIGLDKLLPALWTITRPQGHLLALIKPQFEVGRKEAAENRGVIRDPLLRQRAVERVLGEVTANGFHVLKDAPCRVAGPKGNVEHFVLAERLETPPLARKDEFEASSSAALPSDAPEVTP